MELNLDDLRSSRKRLSPTKSRDSSKPVLPSGSESWSLTVDKGKLVGRERRSVSLSSSNYTPSSLKKTEIDGDAPPQRRVSTDEVKLKLARQGIESIAQTFESKDEEWEERKASEEEKMGGDSQSEKGNTGKEQEPDDGALKEKRKSVASFHSRSLSTHPTIPEEDGEDEDGDNVQEEAKEEEGGGEAKNVMGAGSGVDAGVYGKHTDLRILTEGLVSDGEEDKDEEGEEEDGGGECFR